MLSFFEWHKRFKEGRDSVDDNPQSGRPTTSKTDDCVVRVRELIRANRCLTIHELSVKVGVSYGTCQAILTRHATRCSKTCSANSHRQTGEMALVCGKKHAAGSRVRWKLSSRATRCGSTGMTRTQNISLHSGVCWFQEAKESVPGVVKSQSHAHHFLWYGGHCSFWLHSTRPDCKPTVLSASFETSETCCFLQEATETGCGGLGATSRQCNRTHATFHPGIFGKLWHSLSSSNHPTPLTWLRVTFGCSPN